MCEVAGWITPVPGGVGPMTVAMLMNNALRCAIQLQLKVRVFSTFILAFAYGRSGKFSLLKVLLLSCDKNFFRSVVHVHVYTYMC